MSNNLKISKTERGFALLGAAGILLAFLVVGFFNPLTSAFYPKCPLLSLTGIACPGCGLTRSLHAFLHGDILTALDSNLLLPLFLFLVGYLFVSLVLAAVRGDGLNLQIFRPWLVGIFLMVIIAFGVLRNLPFYPFTVLYP